MLRIAPKVGMTVDLAVAALESLKKVFYPQKHRNAPDRLIGSIFSLFWLENLFFYNSHIYQLSVRNIHHKKANVKIMATTKSVTVGMDKVVISGREQSFSEQKSHASEKTEVWRFFMQ